MLHAWRRQREANLGKHVGGDDEPDGVIGEGLEGRHEVQRSRNENEGLGHPGAGSHRQGLQDERCPHPLSIDSVVAI